MGYQTPLKGTSSLLDITPAERENTDKKHRGTIKTYSRQPARVININDGDLPRKRIRMDTIGTVVKDALDFEAEESYPYAAPRFYKPESQGQASLAGLIDRIQDQDQASSSTARSSPPRSDPTLPSDVLPADAALTSPPSSPPPVLASPPPATRKPAFSFLKRKRSARHQTTFKFTSVPLSDTTHNVLKLPRHTKKPRLTQMQIDLGGEIRKTCSICRMDYVPSNKEDAALHKDFHSMNVGGVDLGKAFLKDAGSRRPHSVRGSLNEGQSIVEVDRRSPLGARNKVKKVLEVVNTEMSAVEITDDQLWAGLEPSALEPHLHVGKQRKASIGRPKKKGGRFKAFLYLDGDTCVGFCLAEKISAACQVVNPQADHKSREGVISGAKSSSIVCSAIADVALLGISRIWTSKAHRGRGIAYKLLDCARASFIFGMEVPKDLMAFSQPTESGRRLAERWFEAETGWHVYTEGQRLQIT